MYKQIKFTVLGCLLVAAPFSSTLALDQGDWIFRIGATGVYPEETSSDPVSTAATGPIPGTAVGPSEAWSLGLTIGYAFSPNWSLELLAAYPFTHDVEANDTLRSSLQGLGLSGSKNIGEIKQLPPTLSANYTFSPAGKVRPYLGAGITYFYPFDEKVTGDLATAGYSNLDVDSAWGVSLQAGIDFDISERWFLNASLRWMDIDTKATLDSGGALGAITVDNIKVDPWVPSIMIGTTF